MQGSLRIGLILYLSFAVLIIIRCRWLRLLSDWLFGADVSAALAGFNKCISTINPGLAPWAVQEYRPFRALSMTGLVCLYMGLSQIVIMNMLICSLLIK